MGVLPTNLVLNQRRVGISSSCPRCGVADETILHCLVNYRVVSDCWHQVGISASWPELDNFQEWLADILSHGTEVKIIRTAMLCWALWGSRNDLVWSQKESSREEIIRFSQQVLDEWMAAISNKKGGLGVDPMVLNAPVRWVKPERETVTINTDTTLFDAEAKVGVGCVARDDQGKLLEAQVLLKSGHFRPEVAEAMGVKEALSWAKGKGWSNIRMETDCLLVAQASCSPLEMCSPFGVLIKECKSISKEFSDCEIYFVK